MLKIHQIFALVDVKYDHVFPATAHAIREKNLMSHFQDVASQLLKKDGLDYVPRDRTTDGRVFEHACDCKVVIDHLATVPDGFQQPSNSFQTASSSDV